MTNTRGITGLLVKELFLVNDEVTNKTIGLYELDVNNELSYVATAGELKTNTDLTSEVARETLKTRCDNIKRRIDKIVMRRMDLIDSEKHFAQHKKRFNDNRLSKTVRRKMVRRTLTYTHEIRQLKSNYLKLAKERAETLKESVLSGKKTLREGSMADE